MREVSLGGYKTEKTKTTERYLGIRYPYCRLALSRIYTVVGVLLYVLMSDLKSTVFVGGNACDAIFLPDFDSFLVVTLIADALIVEILYWFHKSSSCKQ